MVELEDLFVQVLAMAQAMKLVKVGPNLAGRVSEGNLLQLGGTKVKANAFQLQKVSSQPFQAQRLVARAYREVGTAVARGSAGNAQASFASISIKIGGRN
ncbi:MAG: hypothetical protein ACRESZ_09175 [Methylococcales bacterium]